MTSAQSNTTKGSSVDHIIEILTVNVFFDGTNNNLYNVQNRTASLGESYTNDFSNVARLFKAADGASSESLEVYVEGMGTLHDHPDSQVGFAFGAGTTGIYSRAEQAFSLIKRGLEKNFSNKTIHKMTFNVFGFSRGAATARHFVYHVNTKSNTGNIQDLMLSWNVPLKNISVNFVGIYDTVSSFDTSFNNYEGKSKVGAFWEGIGDLYDGKKTPPNFDNDIEDIAGLKISGGHAKRVFHICAQDEYRLFFSLTNIANARSKKIGYEVYLPGAHSDIGGGYNDKSSRYAKGERFDVTSKYNTEGKLTDMELLDTTLFNWFKSKGFFNVAHKETTLGITSSRYVSRAAISNQYAKVHFKTMRLMAAQEGKVKFFSGKVMREEKINGNPDIQKLMNNLPKDIVANAKWGSVKKTDFNHHFTSLSGGLPNFRRRYVHWSSQNATGYDLRRGFFGSDLEHIAAAKTGADRKTTPVRKTFNG